MFTSLLISAHVAGSGRGWTYVANLERALLLSLSRRHSKASGAAQGPFGGGQTVEIFGLKGRKDLNGQFGITGRFLPTCPTAVAGSTTVAPTAVVAAGGGRWEVLLPSGEGVRVKPDNLLAVSHAPESIASPPASHVPDSSQQAAEEGPGAGRVMVFWGVARWTRAQLLGEIARGHW